MSDLEALKRVARADVYKGDDLAAHLTRTGDGSVAFAYTEEWVRAGGPPVASTLPVSDRPVVRPSGALPNYFTGLLPEGRRFAALQRQLKTSADDELSLVLAVGGDTVGDVRVLPEGRSPAVVGARLEVADFGAIRFAELLAGAGVDVDRVGLPGVQEKVSATMVNLAVSTPNAQALLKLNPSRTPYVVENEAFFLAAAREARIETVDAQVVRDAEGNTALAVTRFDRRPANGSIRSLAVEDGCQVLNLPPGNKYLVTTEALLKALVARCEAPRVAAAEFLAQVAFALLSGNGDAHAKNFSVMQDLNGRWQPTPAYDLPSTQFYGDSTLALPIAGRNDAGITGRALVALGAQLDIPERAARKVVDRVAASADVWLDRSTELPFDTARLTKFRRVVAARQRSLRH